MRLMKTVTMALAGLMLAIVAIARTAQAASPTPEPTPSPFPSPPTSPTPVPMLYLKSEEHYTAGGKNWVRHQLRRAQQGRLTPRRYLLPHPICRRAAPTPIPPAPGWTSSINLESASTDFALSASRRTSTVSGLPWRKA